MQRILRSPLPDVEIPLVPLSTWVLDKAARFADKIALVDAVSGRTMSYRDVMTYVRRVASALRKAGIMKGDVVCFYSQNHIEYPVIFHGIIHSGATVTSCNPLCTAEELNYYLADSGATYIVTMPHLVSNVREAIPPGQEIKAVFVIGEAVGCIPSKTLLEDDGLAEPTVTYDVRRDVALMPYSSGTTGSPKAVLQTHYSLMAHVTQLSHPALQFLKPDDVIIGLLPMYHAYGYLVYIILAITSGSTMVISDRFEFSRYLQMIETYQVTTLHVAPPIVHMLANRPEVDHHDISSVRCLFCGTALLSRDTETALRRRLPHVKTRQLFGMTELNITHIGPVDGALAGSVGLLAPNIQSMVVDVEDGHVCGPNESGEMYIYGPQCMLGYRNPPAHEAAMVDGNGWFRTGDIVIYDTEGHFFVVGRQKELMKYKGFQVAPAEIDAILLTHPDVADAATVGVPDEMAGDLPKAFVVRTPGANVSAQQLVDFVADRVAPHKKLRGGVEFIGAIPRTPSGKILRRQLEQIDLERRQQALV